MPKYLSNGIDFGFISFKLPIPTVSLHLGPYLKGECMNQKAKPHKQSLVIGDQKDKTGFGSMPLRVEGVWVQRFNVNGFILR